MADPFFGEIRMFAGNFAPRNWAFCDGQLLSVSQNDALFSLFGTIYGGDGRTTFGLPDMRGRLPIHLGNGPGLSPRPIGQKFGQENVSLTGAQVPPHAHQLRGTGDAGETSDPSGLVLAQTPDDAYSTSPADTVMASTAISLNPGSQPHTNVQPFLCIHFIVALFGIYPSRN